MLTIKLYPADFKAMIQYMRLHSIGSDDYPFKHRQIGRLVMLNYLAKWSPARIYAWLHRKDRLHALKLPVVVALALYEDMQMPTRRLVWHEQRVLDALDQAIVNYRSPYEEARKVSQLLIN